METKETCKLKEMRQCLIEQCKALLEDPTFFNMRRLVALAQCVKDMDHCSAWETTDKQYSADRK
ncbi:MAG: hypothetical protein K2L51_07690 [Clostridiales bacterium]|nr:hypothetical protein [Clostridiales bacterium]